jgi:hypothetical protein
MAIPMFLGMPNAVLRLLVSMTEWARQAGIVSLGDDPLLAFVDGNFQVTAKLMSLVTTVGFGLAIRKGQT